MNTTPTTKAKPTAGPVKTINGIYIKVGGQTVGQSFIMNHQYDNRGKPIQDTEGPANAKLWAEAHEVFNKTNLTPRELVERLNDAIDIIKIAEAALMAKDADQNAKVNNALKVISNYIKATE